MSRRAVATTIAMTVLFVTALSASNTEGVRSADTWIATHLFAHDNSAADIAATLIGVPVSIVGTCVWVGALVLWARHRQQFTFAWLVFAAVITAIVIEVSLKLVWPHSGPMHTRTVGFLAGGIDFSTRGSFPSGHTVRATLLAISTAMITGQSWATRRWWLLTAGAFIVAVACSRVYVRDHWTSDVVGGLLLGGCFLPVIVAHAPRRSMTA